MSQNQDKEEKLQGVQYTKQQLEQISIQKVQNQGMTQYNFFFGLINALFTIYIICQYPQYYWIIFVVKIFIIYPYRIYKGIETKENYYLLELCWVSIAFTAIYFLLIVFKILNSQEIQQLLRVCFVFFNGPQGWSTIAFSNALAFHSFQHNCSIFVHMTPVIASYTLNWNLKEINALFPSIIPLDVDEGYKNNFYQDFYLPTFKLYFIWWVYYTIWLCFSGIHKAQQGYQTIINDNYTKNQGYRYLCDNILFKFQKKGEITKLKALPYVILHFIFITVKILLFFANLSMFWTYLCYNYQQVHFIFILVLITSVTWQASKYYIYQITKAPIKNVEKIEQKLKQN